MGHFSKITAIEIDDHHINHFSPHIKQEYQVAKQDFLLENTFRPLTNGITHKEYILKINHQRLFHSL